MQIDYATPKRVHPDPTLRVTCAFVLAFAMLPCSCFGSMFASAIVVAFNVGHWPTYSNPDPKDVTIGNVMSVAGLIAFFGTILAGA